MSRQNQWFVAGNDIAREVITADIQRYLGPDALVRPGVGTGEYQGQPGYWITAYRTLTSQMIQDLRLDSQRWQAERQPEAGRGGGVAYQDSQTHAARQHWGPTTPYDQQPQQPPSQPSRANYDDRRDSKPQPRPAYSTSNYGQSAGDHYIASTGPYGTGYQPSPTAPRSQPTDQYYQPQQPPTGGTGYQSHQQYSSQPDTYNNRATPVSTGGYPAQSSATAQPGFYIASDGRQYPLSQQPQTNPQPQSSNPQRNPRYPSQQGR